MTKDDVLKALADKPLYRVFEGLQKEKHTFHIGQRAVVVVTKELDLDTDGCTGAGITFDKTHQNETSLKWRAGQSVNSNEINFVVMPGGEWGKRHNLKLGDIGLAWINCHSDAVGVIIADIGPRAKIGEGSLALFRAFGQERITDGRIRDVGIDSEFHMLLFPNSGDGFCHSNDTNEDNAIARLNTL